uniref:Uncharacterized protein n=1 Tax=Oryza nivara TaxID=4536 RepID=A0A0E0J1Q2_ORYNI
MARSTRGEASGRWRAEPTRAVSEDGRVMVIEVAVGMLDQHPIGQILCPSRRILCVSSERDRSLKATLDDDENDVGGGHMLCRHGVVAGNDMERGVKRCCHGVKGGRGH